MALLSQRFSVREAQIALGRRSFLLSTEHSNPYQIVEKLWIPYISVPQGFLSNEMTRRVRGITSPSQVNAALEAFAESTEVRRRRKM